MGSPWPFSVGTQGSGVHSACVLCVFWYGTVALPTSLEISPSFRAQSGTGFFTFFSITPTNSATMAPRLPNTFANIEAFVSALSDEKNKKDYFENKRYSIHITFVAKILQFLVVVNLAVSKL